MEFYNLNFDELEQIIESGDRQKLNVFVYENNLEIRDGKVFPKSVDECNHAISYWSLHEQSSKVSLNSLYGGLLNEGCRFEDKRIGQSTTLTGRQVVKHMTAMTNEVFTGDYNHLGASIIYNDTDSCLGSTIIKTSLGDKTIEWLFENGKSFNSVDDKEYSFDDDLLVASYNHQTDAVYLGNINYIYRHKVSKDLYEIEDTYGNIVTVTTDHSVMVERAHKLIEVKPMQILNTDVLLTIHDLSILRMTPKEVRRIREADDEYVYDIGMKNDAHPWFFGNNILIHNSVYFSAYPVLKPLIDSGEIDWNKETIIEMYDNVCGIVNDSFADFMNAAFNCPASRGSVIKAGRENIASTGLFITKKRYAILVFDKEGRRVDVDGKQGEVKAMGLDLKRSDTPAFVQNFLKEVLEMTLTGIKERDILQFITDFRLEFKRLSGPEKGTPKRVNNLYKFQTAIDRNEKIKIPGHVRAAINWNTMKRIYNDVNATAITDGAKTVVCKLKHNMYGYTSVAYPIDEKNLPSWFLKLPFDHDGMETALITNKIENLLGVLNWDLNRTKVTNMFSSLFDF